MKEQVEIDPHCSSEWNGINIQTNKERNLQVISKKKEIGANDDLRVVEIISEGLF